MRIAPLVIVLVAASYLGLALQGRPTPGPLTPEQGLKSIQVIDGFKVELVAWEPMVMDPVALAWDEDGRMYVVEMGDYPNGPPGGKLKRLEDTDGDGVMDRMTVFADKLNFPTGVFPWRGGVLVTAAPDILWLKDTDGDGISDVRKVVFTGFGEGNQQHRVNGLIWGMDNWIYGANGDSGGIIRVPDKPARPPVNISGRDFRIRPDEGVIETVSGHSQFGIAFDDWGRRFMCDNRCHIRLEILPERYLKRNPYLAVKATTENIAEYGPVGARVYPISPSQERFNDYDNLNHFTSACGIHIYRGGLLGKEFDGNAFVCEPVHNLVHRCKLVPNGPSMIAKRTEENREFLASTDPWFRPVYLNTGPDGALYIVDFYRQVVEHPKWIPLDAQKRLDLKAGSDRGRIYRVVPNDAKSSKRPRLSRAASTELVQELANANAWRRDTAQRLLYERQEPLAAIPLVQMASGHADPQARARALWSLQGLGKLAPQQLAAGLEDEEPRVRTQAVRLAERRLDKPEPIRTILLNMAMRFTAKGIALHDINTPELDYQLALTLGGHPEPEKFLPALVLLASLHADNPWFRAAILSSVGPHRLAFVAGLGRVKSFFESAEPGRLQFVRELAAVIGAAGEAKEIETLMTNLTANGRDPRWQFAAVAGLVEGSARGKSPLQAVLGQSPEWKAIKPQFERILNEAAKVAGTESQAAAARVEAIGLLSLAPFAAAGAVLGPLLDSRQPRELQLAAVQALGRHADPAAATLLLQGWRGYTPGVRREVLEVVFRQRDRLPKLLDALAAGQVLPADLDQQRQQQLLKMLDGDNLNRATTLLGERPNTNRRTLLENFRAVLKLPRDAERGQVVFQKNCATCHRLDNHGVAVGPDLADVRGRPEESLLEDLLDPHKALSPGYAAYIVETNAGQVFTGILALETATSVTLRRAEGAEDLILRKDIAALQSTGQSLMPEGLENQLTRQEFADLIGYLRGEKVRR